MSREEMERKFREAKARIHSLNKKGIISRKETEAHVGILNRRFYNLRTALERFECSVERVADLAGPYIKPSDEN